MPPVKDNEHNSLPHFNRVHFVLDHDSNTCIQPRGVVKLPSENPLEETVSFFPIRKQMLMFSCLGMEPCFYFPFSIPEPPSDLNLCMLVCIAAVSFSSCVHQFLFFLESSATSGPEYLSASSSDYLSSLILERRFSQSFPIGTEYYKTLHSLCIAVRLRVRYISH